MYYINIECEVLCSKIMEKIDFLWSVVKVANYLGISDLEIIREKLKFLKDKKP